MEDLVNRIGELSHMSMCTSDVVLYTPTLKIIFYLRSFRCSVVRCAGGSSSMEFSICSFAGTSSKDGVRI
jgi:hypothetical protein